MTTYPAWAYEHAGDGSLLLNHYAQPIVSPDQFMGEHVATVPATAGEPPVCACGWTRHGGYEMADHLADMGASDTGMRQE